MNDVELKDLVLNVLSGIAPESDYAHFSGKPQPRDELDLDSTDLLNSIAALHAHTKIGIPEAAYPKLFTLDGAISYLQLRHT